MSKYKVRKVEVNPPVVETTGVEAPAGFTIGATVEPGVVSPEFQEKLAVLGVKPLDDLTAPPAPTTLELCTPAEASDFPTVPLATATTEQIIAELKDRGYYGVELRS